MRNSPQPCRTPMRFALPWGIAVACSLVAAGGAVAADAREAPSVIVRSGPARVTEWALPALPTARDPAIDGHGSVYFAVAKGDRIVRFEETSGRFAQWNVPAGTAPHGVIVAPGSRVYFGGYENGTINELDTVSGAVRVIREFGPGSGIYSLAVDRGGNVWFTDRKAGRVGRYSPGGAAVSVWPMDGEPYGLVQAKDGKMWFTRIAADKLGILDPDSGRQEEIAFRPGSKPRRIAVAPDGRVWVTLYGTGKVAVVDPAARKVEREYDMPGGANCGPYSVAVDMRGRVWITLFQTDSVAILDRGSGRIELISLPEKKTGIRNAALGPDGRFWYVAATSGKLGVVQ